MKWCRQHAHETPCPKCARTKVLHVRTTPAQHALFASRARAAGMSLSDWTRKVLEQTVGVDRKVRA
jgi:predicted HicB family RNase H-like nuclease